MPQEALEFSIRVQDEFSEVLRSASRQIQQTATSIRQTHGALADSAQGFTNAEAQRAQTQVSLHTQLREQLRFSWEAQNAEARTSMAQSLGEANELYAQQALLQEEQRSTNHERMEVSLVLEEQLLEQHHQRQLKRTQMQEEQQTALQQAEQQKRLGHLETALGNFAAAAQMGGARQFGLYKALAIGEATISAYLRASKAAATVPFPLNIVVAASELARGIALVRGISAQRPPAAHGGLDYVPREETYLLNRGERVLSPVQNRDLTRFLKRDDAIAPRLVVERMEVHILEHVRDADSLLRMDENELRELLANRIYQAMNALDREGVRPSWATERELRG